MHKKHLTILITGLLIAAATFFYFQPDTDNVETTEKVSAYLKAEITAKDDPAGRLEYERRMLIDPATGEIPDDIRRKELEFASTLPSSESLSLEKGNVLSQWNKRGPINRGGRTRALGIDVRTQTAPNITIIAGGISGGIFKSTDNGSTWSNNLSPASLHSVTCIAQDVRTGQENTWYAGTGEARGNSASGGGGALFFGDGIYKSVDNGNTWNVLPSTSNGNITTFNSAFKFVNNIAVNQATGSVFAAASNVILRSQDGGTTWNTVRSTLASNTMSDVQITSTGVIYAYVPSGFSDAGISRSTDDGNTWSTITPGGFPANYARGVIAIAPSNENIVYLWVYTATGANGTQLWKYDASGGTWTNVTANMPATIQPVAGLNAQGSYNMVLKIKPNDPNFAVIGATNLYRSLDGFATQVSSAGWIGGYATVNNISQYANHHPDQHSMVFLNSNPNILYSGHDGGVSSTNNVTQSSVVWNDLNTGYVTSQFYSLGIDPNTANDKFIAGGLQDNGNYVTVSDNFNTNWIDWNHGADGGYAEVRKTSSTEYTVYLEGQEGWLWRQKYNTSGNQTEDTFIQPNYSGTFAFVNPFVLDLNNNDIMYFAAGDSVMRSTNVSGAATWQTMGNATTGSFITSISVSKSPANRLYVGGGFGEILRIDNAHTGNPTATNITQGKGLPTGYVNCVYVDPSDANKIIAVFSNYGVKSVWLSTNAGNTWTDVSGNLEQNPDGSGNGPSCRWITSIDLGGTDVYYVATSTGLYATTNLNGAATVWVQEGGTAFGNVVCTMVHGRDADDLVVVATHGSGIYSASIVVGVENETGLPEDYILSQNYPNPFNPSTKISFSLPENSFVKLVVFDANGREVGEIASGDYSAGSHSIDFDATGLASGVYYYRLKTDNFVQTNKMILLR